MMSEDTRRPGFFGGLFELLELASRLSDERKSVHREGEFNRGGIKGHWSVNMRLGTLAESGGSSVPVEPPTVNVKPEQAAAAPYLEIHDEGNFLRVIVDLPGGAEAAKNVSVEGDLLIYDDPDNDIHAEWLLPCKVEQKPLNLISRNGLLVIELGKAGDADAQ
jgi:HSP20 family molecular chaperone IbpA